MKRKFKTTYLICGLAVGFFGSFAVAFAAADKPTNVVGPNRSPPIVDIALRGDGTLTGRVVAPDGTPLSARTVTLSSGTRLLKNIKTNSAGCFVFREVSAGNLVLKSGDYSQHMRVWPQASAPPIAQAEAKLVCGPTVRGQFGGTIGGFTAPSIHPARYLRHPATIGGVIGLAIAAPLAIHNEIASIPATMVYSPSLSYLPQYP